MKVWKPCPSRCQHLLIGKGKPVQPATELQVTRFASTPGYGCRSGVRCKCPSRWGRRWVMEGFQLLEGNQTQRQTPPTLGDGALHGKATQQQFDAASSAALRATELPLHRRNEGLTANVSGSPICPDCPANRPKVDRFIYQACSASASAKLKGLVDRQLLHGHASSSSLGRPGASGFAFPSPC